MGVWHALGARAAAIRGDGPRPERGRHARIDLGKTLSAVQESNYGQPSRALRPWLVSTPHSGSLPWLGVKRGEPCRYNCFPVSSQEML